MPRVKKSLSEAVSKEIRSKFDLSSFKEKKGLKQNVKFKEQTWIPLSQAFQDVTSIPGIPMGHIVLLRGHSDTGKTTALLETAVSAQKRGVLPVFIITEMKWNWEHAKQMGLQVEEVVDKDTGEITNYEGEFIYADRETIHTIEDVAKFILDLIDELILLFFEHLHQLVSWPQYTFHNDLLVFGSHPHHFLHPKQFH